MSCRDQAGQQVGGARPRIAKHNGDLTGGLIQPLGHVHPGCLMTDRHETDAVGLQSGEEWVDLGAR